MGRENNWNRSRSNYSKHFIYVLFRNKTGRYRPANWLLTLTTFCLSNSNLSHLSWVTSCRKPSTRESPFCASQHRLHGLPLGVSADDMLSRPVSLSTAPPAIPRPSSSTLFSDDESLSDIATRLAPLRENKIKYRRLDTVVNISPFPR